MIRLALLDYISQNYEKVVKPTKGGEYIEIDLIPDGDNNKLYSTRELVESCEKLGIDITMFIRSYPIRIGDGIRMGRFMCFMQETTRQILSDLERVKK